ncbi:MAG: hypothetical protein L3J57_13995 [Desulfuromusa sp.]|nr:hypothetical protein [Desulfuromusa sp.]
MSRLPDWQSRLYNEIQARMNVPFQWGENDCLMFVSDMVLAVTGIDYAADYRDLYTDEDAANNIMLQLTPEGTVTGIIDLFFDRIPVLQASRGDLVARPSHPSPAAGICAGGGCYFVGPDGLFKWPLQSCITAWRVK